MNEKLKNYIDQITADKSDEAKQTLKEIVKMKVQQKFQQAKKEIELGL